MMFSNKQKMHYLIRMLFFLGLLISPILGFKIQAADPLTIAICQAGYSTHQIKRAVAVVKGTLTNKDYQIIRTRDGATVAQGMMVKTDPPGWTRGETYYLIDFSDFDQVGILS